jgi:hypothetical protein
MMRHHPRRGYRLPTGVYTHPAQVPGVICRRGKRRLNSTPVELSTGLKKGAMTKQAVKLGYINKGETISDIPKSKIDDFARDLANSVGTNRAMKMVQVQINFRADRPDGFRDKMLIAKGAIRRKSKVLRVRK